MGRGVHSTLRARTRTRNSVGRSTPTKIGDSVNNAEHAIKALVRLRNRDRREEFSQGYTRYLVLLSICETCKCKGASFLDFLRSGEMDVNSFADQS